MQINPYLSFNGQCEAAFTHYEKVLGGRIAMLSRFGETPGCEEMPRELHDQIMHVRLQVGDQVLMGSDSPPEYHEDTKGMSVAINVEDTAEGERIFNGLADGGTVRMPYEETSWAQRFGMCVDRFGTPWMVNAGMKNKQGTPAASPAFNQCRLAARLRNTTQEDV